MAKDNSQDEEKLDTILEAFEEDGRLDMDYIDIEVVDSGITLSGRVSTEEEMEIVVEVMQGLKLTDYTNNIWVDDSLGLDDADDDENGGVKNLNFDDDDIEESDFQDDEEDKELM